MGCATKWLGAAVAMVLLVEIPGFSKEPWNLVSPVMAQTESAETQLAEANRLLEQGTQQYNVSQFREALRSWEQALEIYREIEDRHGEGNTLRNLGNAYLQIGNYEEAVNSYEKYLAIVREAGNRSGEGSGLLSLGWAYSFQGKYQLAIDFFDQALKIREEVGDSIGISGSLYALGWIYHDLGQLEQSREFYEEALNVSRSIANPNGEANALNGLGWLAADVQDYDSAIELFSRQRDIGNAMSSLYHQAGSFNGLGFVYRKIGKYDEAIGYSKRALVIHRQMGDQREEAYALGDIGNVYADLGNYQESIKYLTQCLAIQRTINNRWGEGITLSSIAKVFKEQNQPELAITFLKASVDVRESIRGDIRSLDTALQQSFTDTVADDYRLLADLLLQQNRILEAQRVLDLLKVQELDDSLRGVRSTSNTSSAVAFWQVETDLLALYNQVMADSHELAQLQAADYDSLSPEQQQRLTTLRQHYADVQSRFTSFLDLPEVRTLLANIRQETDGQNLAIEQQHRALQNNLRRLPQETALLYPLILPDRLELVLVTADGPPLRYPIDIKGEDLNRAIVAFGQALKDPRSDIQPLAQQLYTWLVAPLEPQLEQVGIESLLYAPDGALRYVPLAALHDGEQYLAQRFSLSHITAASLTNFDQVPNTEGRRLLAAACAECSFTVNVGGTTFPFGDLPYTETEVKALAEQMPNTSVLLNQGFSLRELENRLGSYSIIHLATHGAVVENQPSQSFVVMGSGEHVTLEAIRQSWSLSHAELVVLSACETAVGSPQLGSGVEILGLGYQIQEAGALGVLASLWKVSDQGTQVLMSAFYDALSQGMTKAEALQAAQTALITGDFSAVGGDRATIELISTATGQPLVAGGSLAHPYYWAPFILIGNGL